MYLDDLDQLLRGGAASLGAGLRERQRKFVLERQREDGGWSGRQGASDPYYTDFALRILTVTGGDVEGRRMQLAADFITAEGKQWQAARTPGAVPIVEIFSLLNCARMLSQDLMAELQTFLPPLSLIVGHLAAWKRLPGGFARRGGEGTSAYASFLAALCFEMLGEPISDTEAGRQDACATIKNLKRPGGGYADLAEGGAGQTSATAAAVAFLTMSGALTRPDGEAVDFLCAMQDEIGGFRACAGAPESDLLSTFTALVTLFAMDGMKRVNLKGVVRFAGALAAEGGGFRATHTDTEPDLEYTYYGLGTLALVKVYIELLKSFD